MIALGGFLYFHGSAPGTNRSMGIDVQPSLQDISLSRHARILTALLCAVTLCFCSHNLTIAAASQQNPMQTSGVLLQDDFNGATIDASKWNANALFSGFTDTNVAISQAG